MFQERTSRDLTHPVGVPRKLPGKHSNLAALLSRGGQISVTPHKKPALATSVQKFLAPLRARNDTQKCLTLDSLAHSSRPIFERIFRSRVFRLYKGTLCFYRLSFPNNLIWILIALGQQKGRLGGESLLLYRPTLQAIDRTKPDQDLLMQKSQDLNDSLIYKKFLNSLKIRFTVEKCCQQFSIKQTLFPSW